MDSFPFELIRLTDRLNSVRVRVLNPMVREPGCFDAEILVESSFVTGRLWLYLSPSKLESWGHALDELAAGRDVVWMDLDRGPSIGIRFVPEAEGQDIGVGDDSASLVTVTLPVHLPEGWVEEQRERLRRFTGGAGGSE
ncbi:DUF5959 family protein [Embleya sp. NPDC020886]|uniref:DUF5959 family protein n=1 Tax=Embleya sp. NPDC020886 TaxID=3363980 RepID=UPI00378B1672